MRVRSRVAAGGAAGVVISLMGAPVVMAQYPPEPPAPNMVVSATSVTDSGPVSFAAGGSTPFLADSTVTFTTVCNPDTVAVTPNPGSVIADAKGTATITLMFTAQAPGVSKCTVSAVGPSGLPQSSGRFGRAPAQPGFVQTASATITVIGSGGGGGGGSSKSGAALPKTGAGSAPVLAAVGGALLLAGVAGVVAARRRETRAG